jgi:hypothetical protein
MENRNVASLANGYATNMQRMSPEMKPNIVTERIGAWWETSPRDREGGRRSATNTLTVSEKLMCLDALLPAGHASRTRLLDRLIRGESDMQDVSETALGVFEMGHSLRTRKLRVKTIPAPTRSDAVACPKYVLTVYGEGKSTSKCVASVHKIVAWRSRQSDTDIYYAFFVKNYTTTSSMDRSTSVTSVTVDLKSHPRGAARGEWVSVQDSVDSRAPILLPKIRARGRRVVVMYDNLFNVLAHAC